MIPTLSFTTPEPPERDHGTGWQAHSACIGEDPDLFFPERGDNASVRAAKAVCARCPVVADCLDHAMGNNDRGVLAQRILDAAKILQRSHALLVRKDGDQ